MKGFSIQGSNKKILEQILSMKSRLCLMKDFCMQGSNEKVTKVVPLCKNNIKGQIFLYFNSLEATLH